jgi:hypothetical protein
MMAADMAARPKAEKGIETAEREIETAVSFGGLAQAGVVAAGFSPKNLVLGISPFFFYPYFFLLLSACSGSFSLDKKSPCSNSFVKIVRNFLLS